MKVTMYGMLSVIGGAATVAAATIAPAPVCIIGTGPAGLAAAHKLEAKGESVVMFDKQPLVGGKCQAYYDNNTFHPLGALLFTNSTYTESLKIIAGTTVKAREFDDGVPRWSYSRSGAITPYPSFTPEEIVLLAAEILRYNLFWTTSFAPISAVGYPSSIPKELTVSTLQWCNDNGYKVLPVLFNLAMFSYGYGDLRETPILYMLQYFHPDVVSAFANITPGYIIDFHEVFVQYAKGIKSPIRLNATISKIDRSGSSPVVTYSVKGSSSSQQKQTCSSLILAFPPTVAALNAANLDITAAERTLFSQVELTNYFSGAVSTVLPANQLYYANSSTPLLPPEAVGAPVGILRLFNQSRITTTWSWGAFGQTYTLQQARDLLISALSKINKADPANADTTAAVPFTSADVKAFRSHDYFPRVSGEQLAGGWYQRFDRLQGQKKTYYASGLNALETVEYAVRAGQDVVKKIPFSY